MAYRVYKCIVTHIYTYLMKLCHLNWQCSLQAKSHRLTTATTKYPLVPSIRSILLSVWLGGSNRLPK